MKPFAFHVHASNYRRRPSVRLSAPVTREPFRVDWCGVFIGVMSVIGLGLALAPIFMMQAGR